jgi:hypothetical protein
MARDATQSDFFSTLARDMVPLRHLLVDIKSNNGVFVLVCLLNQVGEHTAILTAPKLLFFLLRETHFNSKAWSY